MSLKYFCYLIHYITQRTNVVWLNQDYICKRWYLNICNWLNAVTHQIHKKCRPSYKFLRVFILTFLRRKLFTIIFQEILCYYFQPWAIRITNQIKLLIWYHLEVKLHYMKLVCIYVSPQRYHAMICKKCLDRNLRIESIALFHLKLIFEPYPRSLQLYWI